MFGDIVRAHRRRLGLSQEELADQAGVNTRTIGNLEGGRIAAPRPATVRLLADAFGLRGAERDSFCAAAVARYFAGRVDELELLDRMEFGGAGRHARPALFARGGGSARSAARSAPAGG